MPTDTKLNNLIINYLTQAQYDAIQTPNENELYLTPDNSTGGGGVSPCLNLLTEDLSAVRTSITEEEKVNLEKGLYNSVLFMDFSLGESGLYSMYFPEPIVSMSGSFILSTYSISADESTGAFFITGSKVYMLTIGEKSSDGTYPITTSKAIDAFFGSAGSNGIETIEVSNGTYNSDGSYTYHLPHSVTSSPYILKTVDNDETSYYLMTGDSTLSLGMRPIALSDSLFVGNFITVEGTTATKRTTNFPPQAKSADNGKVLSIANGTPTWSDPPRYEHTITIKNSEGKILWTQTMRNSSNTIVNSYTNLKTLFGEATYAGFGEYCQLDLRGGTEATDKLIKADGTEATLASLGAIVYTDDCFLPK